MKLNKIYTIVLAAVFALGACSKAADKTEGEKPAEAAKAAEGDKAPEAANPAPTAADPAAAGMPAPVAAEKPGDDMIKTAETVVKMFESMVSVVDGAGDDCDKMAEGIQKVGDDNKDAIAKSHEMEKTATPGQQEWLKQNMSEKMKPVMMKLFGALSKCKDNEKLKKAMEFMAPPAPAGAAPAGAAPAPAAPAPAAK